MKGNFHVQFLGEGVAATSPPYPTPGWATTPVYPAQDLTGSYILRRQRTQVRFPPLRLRDDSDMNSLISETSYRGRV